MNNLDKIFEYYPDSEFLSADGLDDAIIGVFNEKIVYSQKKCIELLVNRDGMSDEEALEFYYFNIECAYVGEKTPIWVDDMFLNE